MRFAHNRNVLRRGAAMAVVPLLIALLSLRLVQGDDLVQPGPPDFCLQGPFHKSTPGPEEEEFSECLSWESNACCNVALSESISRHKAVGLYNYSWDLCGTLSPQCEEFIKDEECFYQCEPMLGYFQIATTGYISGVPVCANYCDAWFEACKNDTTCVEDWLADFHFEEDGTNRCPANSMCVTFQQMYGDGRGLCNRMWGQAFFYETNRDNCTVMRFDSTQPNPNSLLTFPSGTLTVQVTGALLLFLVVMATLL